jgi:hypothetical protein
MPVSEDGDDADDPEDLVEWTAFGLIFVLRQLAFEDARPRELSALDYRERDELSVSDFFEGLTFRGGALHFRADYIRGRRVKTDITVRSDGSITVATVGRGKAPLRWLDWLKGKRAMRVVVDEQQDPP